MIVCVGIVASRRRVEDRDLGVLIGDDGGRISGGVAGEAAGALIWESGRK